MENPNQLAERFREVFLHGKWIANTNLQAQLADVTWEEANHKIGTLNTIALLTFHINYYVAGVLNVFHGGNLDIRDKYSFDMPNLDSEADWETLKNDLFRNAATFAEAIEKMDEEQLEAGFVQPEYGTYRRNIEGMIEHCYYHFGQISLIKKLVKMDQSKRG